MGGGATGGQRAGASRDSRDAGPARPVTLGVDTHADVHVAAALAERGRRLGTRSVPTTPAGFAELAAWAGRFGPLERAGIEGTGRYGAGLARWLGARGVTVVEVDRPDRRARRRHGTSDSVDAEAAARAVQAGTAAAQPRVSTSAMAMLRALRVARQAAVTARAQAANHFHALVVTAPDGRRAQLRPLTLARLVTRAAAFRGGRPPTTPEAATRLALRLLALRYRRRCAEGADVDTHVRRLLTASHAGGRAWRRRAGGSAERGDHTVRRPTRGAGPDSAATSLALHLEVLLDVMAPSSVRVATGSRTSTAAGPRPWDRATGSALPAAKGRPAGASRRTSFRDFPDPGTAAAGYAAGDRRAGLRSGAPPGSAGALPGIQGHGTPTAHVSRVEEVV